MLKFFFAARSTCTTVGDYWRQHFLVSPQQGGIERTGEPAEGTYNDRMPTRESVKRQPVT